MPPRTTGTSGQNPIIHPGAIKAHLPGVCHGHQHAYLDRPMSFGINQIPDQDREAFELRRHYNVHRGSKMQFRWIEWNREHIAEHGVDWEEAETIIRQARRPFPRKIGDDKWLVIGRGSGGRLLQVVYVPDPEGSIFIIHARPLTETEKRRYRRRWKR